MKQESARQPTTARRILDSVLAGSTLEELHPEISFLSKSELQALLCTLCAERKEIAAAYPERSPEVEEFLQAKCTLYKGDSCVCPIGFFYKMKE